jgi:hypothetical protein
MSKTIDYYTDATATILTNIAQTYQYQGKI